jgi:hypothetical protein
VLHGADPLAGIEITPELERFLCEQALRNLRLRLAHSFITRERHGNYGSFLARSVTALVLRVSEVVRLSGGTYANGMEERIPAIAQHLGLEASTLVDLLALKAAPRKLGEEEAVQWHGRTFQLLNTVIAWIEANWPAAHRVE